MKSLHLLFALAAFTFLDQASKEMAVQAHPFPPAMSFLNGIVRFRLAENTGLFMSFGDTFPEPVRFWLFTVSTAIVLGALLVYSLMKPGLPGLQRISIAMMAGGGLSNVIDRFLHEGAVIDFV
jgi:signal peptidase II